MTRKKVVSHLLTIKTWSKQNSYKQCSFYSIKLELQFQKQYTKLKKNYWKFCTIPKLCGFCHQYSSYLICPFILVCRSDLPFSCTLLFRKVWIFVQEIPLKLSCRNKSHMNDSVFNIFLSFVHWTCTNENTCSKLALWGGLTEQCCGIFSNTDWHLPFFWFSKYLTQFWHARKLVNSSLLGWLSVNFKYD
jgi:hypothetical protein